MEAFSLLKYWRGSGAATAGATPTPNLALTNASTIVNNANGEIIDSDDEGNADDGPFFDMEFTVDGDERVKNKDNFTGLDDIHESDDESDGCDCEDEGEGEDENDGELKFTLSSASSGDSIDPNISLSPSDDLFFKGRLVPEADTDTDTNTNSHAKPVSKSTKLRVLMLKLRKSTKLSATKAAQNEENVVQDKPEKEDIRRQKQIKPPVKFFTVKFKVDEVPVLSMFTRDNSSKVAITKQNKENKESTEKPAIEEEERVFSREMVNKYLKKVKPLYVRVSKRYGEKLGFSGHLSLAGGMKAGTGTRKGSELSKSQGESTQLRNVKSRKQGISFPGKLRVVRKQLGKSKSASSTVTAAADSPPVAMVAKRRDDSLLQQQDGIQSAIMHCKRSFKASRELEGKGENGGNENASIADLSRSVDKAKGDMH